MMQTAPRCFQFLEIFVVQDPVDLFRQLAIELGNHRLDRLDDVGADERRLRQRLLRQRVNRPFDRLAGFIRLRLELPRKQRLEIGDFDGAGGRGRVLQCLCLGHGCFSAWLTNQDCAVPVSAGFGADASVCSSAGSCSSRLTSSSAPVLPSM